MPGWKLRATIWCPYTDTVQASTGAQQIAHNAYPRLKTTRLHPWRHSAAFWDLLTFRWIWIQRVEGPQPTLLLKAGDTMGALGWVMGYALSCKNTMTLLKCRSSGNIVSGIGHFVTTLQLVVRKQEIILAAYDKGFNAHFTLKLIHNVVRHKHIPGSYHLWFSKCITPQ